MTRKIFFLFYFIFYFQVCSTATKHLVTLLKIEAIKAAKLQEV